MDVELYIIIIIIISSTYIISTYGSSGAAKFVFQFLCHLSFVSDTTLQMNQFLLFLILQRRATLKTN